MHSINFSEYISQCHRHLTGHSRHLSKAILILLAMLVIRMLLERCSVGRLLEVLPADLADDGLGCFVGFQLRSWAFVLVFGIPLTLGGCFGAVAHFDCSLYMEGEKVRIW